MKKRIIYVAWGLFALVTLSTIVGVVYEISGKRRTLQEFPPPGKLVDIGGRKIQLDCRGIGSPTVIFESGLDWLGSLSWSLVHDEIAKTTRACAYSRAGLMWSDPNDTPLNGKSVAKSVAEDLRATLSKAGEQGPFVLVGHSAGAAYITNYAKYFGGEVAGLVFVDGAHPDEVPKTEVVESMYPKLRQTELELALPLVATKIGAALAWTGLTRVLGASLEGLPNMPERDVQAMRAYTSTSLGPFLKEGEAFEQSKAEAGTFRQFGRRPVFVLTAEDPVSTSELAELDKAEAQQIVAKDRQIKKIFNKLDAERAAWSSRGQWQRVPGAGHYIQFDRPDVVVAAVLSVVEEVRADQDESTPYSPHQLKE